MGFFKKWFNEPKPINLKNYVYDESKLINKLIDEWTIDDIKYCVDNDKLLAYHDTSGNYILNHLVANSNGDDPNFELWISTLFDRYENDESSLLSKDHVTPMMLAAIHGNRNVLLMTLDKRFSINAIDDKGHNALYHAIDNDHEMMAIELLSAGIHWNLAISKRATLMAKTKGFDRYMSIYNEKSGDIERRHKERVYRESIRPNPSLLQVKAIEDDLIHNCIIGNFDEVKRIIENNSHCNINYKEVTKGLTALICAAINNRVEIIDYLVKRGACINAVDKNNKSALHHASFHGSKQSIYKLLSYEDIIVDFVDKDKKMAIMYAIKNRLENVVKKMLEKMELHRINAYQGHANIIKYTLFLEKQNPNKYLSLLSLLYSYGARTYIEHLWEKQIMIQVKLLHEIDLENTLYLQESPQYEYPDVPEYKDVES